MGNLQENIDKDLAPIMDKNTDLIGKLMTNKIYQFRFGNGLIMGNKNLPLNTKISLNYHIENSNTFEEFLGSVLTFIHSADKTYEFSEMEKSKLEAIWRS